MVDFGQEIRAKSGSRGSEAAVQSSKAPEELFKVLSPINYESVSIGAERKATESWFKVQMQQSCGSIAYGERSALPLSERSGERIFTNLVQNYNHR